MRTTLIAILLLLIASSIEAEVWHEDTPEYRRERAEDRLHELEQMAWDWDTYSSSERVEIRAEARELKRAINRGRLSYEEAYGETYDEPVEECCYFRRREPSIRE